MTPPPTAATEADIAPSDANTSVSLNKEEVDKAMKACCEMEASSLPHDNDDVNADNKKQECSNMTTQAEVNEVVTSGSTDEQNITSSLKVDDLQTTSSSAAAKGPSSSRSWIKC